MIKNVSELNIFIKFSEKLLFILFRLKYANLFLEHDSFFFNQSAKLKTLFSDVLNR